MLKRHPLALLVALLAVVPVLSGCSSTVAVNTGQAVDLRGYSLRFNVMNPGRFGFYSGTTGSWDENLLQTLVRTAHYLEIVSLRADNVQPDPNVTVTITGIHPVTGRSSGTEYPPDVDFRVSVPANARTGEHEITFDIGLDRAAFSKLETMFNAGDFLTKAEAEFGKARIAALRSFLAQNAKPDVGPLPRIAAYSLKLHVS